MPLVFRASTLASDSSAADIDHGISSQGIFKFVDRVKWRKCEPTGTRDLGADTIRAAPDPRCLVRRSQDRSKRKPGIEMFPWDFVGSNIRIYHPSDSLHSSSRRSPA
ncbi:hypothetical protein BV25DRAFT_1649644 [Artomyces pyxidatus]|uniref:Uncharacterized protein n=1 Tax=Artomyces pyxidatus TaxID=48021 RepID=A0ACB8SIJ2_9AGAM|nr:hypothetical protein BV25DRAFT_1649644 [Artomyces pyxidatus]